MKTHNLAVLCGYPASQAYHRIECFTSEYVFDEIQWFDHDGDEWRTMATRSGIVITYCVSFDATYDVWDVEELARELG